MAIDRSTPPRAHVSTSGTFAAVPQGFEGADGSLRFLLKSEFIALPADGDTSRIVLRTPTEWGLLDKAAASAGGGLLGTLLLVGGALLLSCQFAHCNSDKEESTPPK